MRLKALRRANPYLDTSIAHKPTHGISPFEKTFNTLFNGGSKVVSERKECVHCCLSLKLSSNGRNIQQPTVVRLAEFICVACSSNICKVCSKVCENCKLEMCFVCSMTVYQDSETYSLCPECLKGYKAN